ncbi:hypothetical protein [Phytohalomonas tamaricis]|nr:hypothetical protein [Phytohalomonas tamaricis]
MLCHGAFETVLDDFMPPEAGLHAIMVKNHFRPRRFGALIDYLRAGLAAQ